MGILWLNMKNKASLWYRSKGDLYASFKQKRNGDTIREVEFTNAAAAAVIIRQIEIHCNEGKHTFIKFKVSPFKWDIFKYSCSMWFSDEGEDVLIYSDYRKSITVKWTQPSFINMMAMFLYLNLKYDEIFDVNLESELSNINALINGKENCIQQHLIQPGIPDISPDNDIITLFKTYGENNSPLYLEKNLKKALVAGANPNQKNVNGETPLSVLFLHMNAVLVNREILFLLLFSYGANIWVSVNKLTGYSLIELFKYQQSPEDFEYWESWLKSPVYLQKISPVRIEGIDLIATKKTLCTTISLNDSSILWSELKAMHDLEYEEKKALFPLYAQAFQARDGDILTSFDHAFAPLCGKLIDIIRNQYGRIVGANVFIINGNEKSILVYIDLSFLHPDYRGMGIMPLIDFRLPFALQHLFGEHQISILFLSASYHAMRKVEGTLFFPKYQTENMMNCVKSAFTEVYNSPLQWTTPDDIYWTVSEENQVVVTPPLKDTSTPMEIFYYTQLCGSQKGYVPVMLYPGLDMLQKLHALLAPRQVNFLRHCRELSDILSQTKILTDINPAFENRKPSHHIYKSREMFWNAQRIPIPESVINDAFSHPEMHHKMNAKF